MTYNSAPMGPDDDDDDDDDVRAVLAACSHLGTEKLNFVFWFFSFVCCATMRAIIAAVLKKDKEDFRRLHLPPEVTSMSLSLSATNVVGSGLRWTGLLVI